MKDYNERTTYGVGFRGFGKFGRYDLAYRVWAHLFQRCYTDLYPTYKDSIIVDEWHNLQNFGKWFEENYVEGYHLDKDILIKGNKIYGPDTCCFVPQEINKLFTKTNKLRGDLPIGVVYSNGKFQVKINKERKHVGTFSTSIEAFNAYKKAKEEKIKEVAEQWKDKIPNNVYLALYNYEVEITD